MVRRSRIKWFSTITEVDLVMRYLVWVIAAPGMNGGLGIWPERGACDRMIEQPEKKTGDCARIEIERQNHERIFSWMEDRCRVMDDSTITERPQMNGKQANLTTVAPEPR